jgi:hypothetical protein
MPTSGTRSCRRRARSRCGWAGRARRPCAERRDGATEAERAGRDPDAVARATVAFVSVGGDVARERGLSWMASLYGLPARSFERHLVVGDARHCARALARFTEAGARHVAVFVTSDDPLVQFEDLAGEFAGLLASPLTRSAAADALHPGGSGHEHQTHEPAFVGEVVSIASGTPVEDQVWR